MATFENALSLNHRAPLPAIVAVVVVVVVLLGLACASDGAQPAPGGHDDAGATDAAGVPGDTSPRDGDGAARDATGAGSDGSVPLGVVTTIIDTHTHFYDPSRAPPPGRDRPVPFPAPNDGMLYRTILPAEYVKLTQPLGITGTVVIEASSWLEDNQWILDLAAQNPIIVGFVGNLDEVLGKPTFDAALDKLKQNPLFRGIRTRSVRTSDATVLGNFKRLADADLMVETWASAADAAYIGMRVPNLRLVVGMPGVPIRNPPPSWFTAIEALAKQPNVFLKVVGVTDDAGPDMAAGEPDLYRRVLDHIFKSFGEDRVVYGSNWPVSALYMPYTPLPTIHNIVLGYITARGQEATDKFLWKNAGTAYKWVQR